MFILKLRFDFDGSQAFAELFGPDDDDDDDDDDDESEGEKGTSRLERNMTKTLMMIATLRKGRQREVWQGQRGRL